MCGRGALTVSQVNSYRLGFECRGVHGKQSQREETALVVRGFEQVERRQVQAN
jgi:hypothetical protein